MIPRPMTNDPHPFHIIGECQDCCDESEAMRLGCPENPMLGYCETSGCINSVEFAPSEADLAALALDGDK